MKKYQILLTCEHASNKIPPLYSSLFKSKRAQEILTTHRGYDLGAKSFAQALQKILKCKLYKSSYSRLLIDNNRTLNHPGLWSEFTKHLEREEKQIVIDKYYLPHYKKIAETIEQRPTIHLAIHSFTPVLRGQVRNADIGLLYDSRKKNERVLAQIFKQELFNQFKVRLNYPYRGSSNCLLNYFRKMYSDDYYLGIEIELNQKIFAH